MIAVRALLAGPAREAGIKLPDDLDEFDLEEYPHWAAYCVMQLGRRIPSMTEHWSNAKIVAAIPDDKIKLITRHEIEELGFQ